MSNYEYIKNAIDETLNDDVVYQRKPLDLRNQRTYAVKVSNTNTQVIKLIKSSDRGEQPA